MQAGRLAGRGRQAGRQDMIPLILLIRQVRGSRTAIKGIKGARTRQVPHSYPDYEREWFGRSENEL